MKTYTKTFVESRYEKREKGGAPDDWEHVSHTEPVDDQVRTWVDASNANIITVSAPGIEHVWANKEMTLKCILLAYVVIYVPGGGSS